MIYKHWTRLSRAFLGRVWRPGAYWLALLGIFLLIASPYFVEKYVVTTLQSELQKSAVQFADELATRLETEKKGFYRAAMAANDPQKQFKALSKAWLNGTPNVLAVTLLDSKGTVIQSAPRSDRDSGAAYIAAWEALNQIGVAHAFELQEPAFSALQQVQNESVVNLFIPTGAANPVLFVVTLDTQQWTSRLADGGEHPLSAEIIPFRADLASDYGRYYINSTAWEGLWTLKFQSKNPLFELLQTLRPVFFVLTWLIVGLFFLYWRNFRLRQKAELELQSKSQLLEKQNRLSLLGEMSAQLAHEINQPLATIANYAVAGTLQLQNDDPDGAIASLFQEILEQSQRAAQVLVAVRAILQPSPMELSDIDVDGLIHKLEPALRFLCAPYKISLEVSTTKSSSVRLNPILFEQVIFNLVKNSIQALTESDRPDKRITISCAENAQRLTIDVADNGPGIAADHAPQVFESFFTTKAEGLGIGLSLCRSVIERFNGRLTLKSNSHRGVCFLIDLPMTPMKPEEIPS